jgi:hypothetical protein
MAEDKNNEALTSSSYGWCGKILKVDLSSEVITEIDTKPHAQLFGWTGNRHPPLLGIYAG